jgi:UDPglucose--hexose-1-phosphate uridylyltransferase
MPVLRQDPTTRDWVILAPGRGDRPQSNDRASVKHRPRVALDPACPLCPGNEDRTPPELLRLPEGESDWLVRVVPNKYPAVTPEGDLRRREAGPFFREVDGTGHHELIVETPVHDRVAPLMTSDEIMRLLRAYQLRYWALRRDPRVNWVVLFKNYGEGAGTSLEHPHSQIVALPMPPAGVRRKYDVATAHFDDTGRCLYCDLLEAELQAGVRIVEQTERFVVLHPFASRGPFETWVLPREAQPSFTEVAEVDMAEVAEVLARTLRALHSALDDPDFNLVLESAPVGDEFRPYFLWHIRIVPRLGPFAGFEVGSGMAITSLLPEESAARMRDTRARTGVRS